MKKKLTTITASIAALSVAAIAGMSTAAIAQDLTIVGWGGTTQAAHKPAYFEPFMKETGINVIEDEWNGELAKIRAMVETGNVTWDVVQVEGPEVDQGCAEGLFEELDWSRITDKANMVDGTVKECGAGILIWSVIFAYDGDKITGDAPQNWADFWNVDKWPGKRGMRRGAKPMLEIALMADGVAKEDVYNVLSTPEGVDQAFAKLDELKPNILWWKAGAEPQQRLGAGDVAMTAAYNAWVYRIADEEGRNFKMVWDGNQYSTDYWTIIKGTKNLDSAYKFLELSMRPDRQAVFFNKVTYGWTAKGTGEFVDKKVLQHLPTYGSNMDNALETSGAFWLENGESLEKRFQAWVSK